MAGKVQCGGNVGGNHQESERLKRSKMFSPPHVEEHAASDFEAVFDLASGTINECYCKAAGASADPLIFWRNMLISLAVRIFSSLAAKD
jgi:hypothetical protein